MSCFLGFASAKSLQTLRLRRSEMSDSIVEQTIGRLSTVTFLDLSYCGKIGCRALEAIGKNCKLLMGLCRNIHPSYSAGMPMNDEAHAIANTMPRLKHLEIAYHIINTQGAIQILKSCPELEFLDLRGCWDVELDDKFFGEKFPKLKVLGPPIDLWTTTMMRTWNVAWMTQMLLLNVPPLNMRICPRSINPTSICLTDN